MSPNPLAGVTPASPPDLSKFRPGFLLLHAPVGHQVVENLTWGGGHTRQGREGRGERQPCPLPACCPAPPPPLTPAGVLHDEVKRLLRLDHLKELHCKRGKAGLEGGGAGWGPPQGWGTAPGTPPRGGERGAQESQHAAGGLTYVGVVQDFHYSHFPEELRGGGQGVFLGGGGGEMLPRPMCPPKRGCPPSDTHTPPPHLLQAGGVELRLVNDFHGDLGRGKRVSGGRDCPHDVMAFVR